MEDRQEIVQTNGLSFRVAVISDTHIPDRVDGLHPLLIDQIKSLNVDMIFHCGDISIGSVLRELEQVAPLRAVTGNRDFLLSKELPVSHELLIYKKKVVITHGHLNPRVYWADKFSYLRHGYDFERYRERLELAFPDADAIIYGHTHHPENEWQNGKLFFNPGSVSRGDIYNKNTYYGLLIFNEDGRIDASIIPLTGAVIQNKKWMIAVK
jgi:putative phosphoesterase